MGRDSEKFIVEDSKKITIWWLRKKGFINGNTHGTMWWVIDGDESTKSSISFTVDTDSLNMRFNYTQTSNDDEVRKMDYSQGLSTTKCNFGGERYWFICRLSKNGRFCGKRVGVLYKPPGQWYWGCRHCHNLNYYSQRLNHNNIFCEIMNLDDRIEKLENEIKRKFWQGRPTKKYKRLLKLY